MARYLQKVESGEISAEPAQREVMQLLDDLFVALNREAPEPTLLDRVKNVFSKPEQPEPIKGLYVWGGVGRGKTMLMDMFFEALPPNRRMRLHFHRFMKRVHDRLNHWGGVANPLVKVAEEFAAEADVLCFDEFFVTDIGDAMILAEVLTALFDLGVTLVATSNVEPSRLYENGLQRRRFLPAIDLINQRTHVYHVVDGVDFRLRALEQAEIYHWPLGDAAEDSLRNSFMSLAPDTPVEGEILTIEGREIPTRMVADDVVWFEFADLCQGPRSQNDYIELAMVYHAVLMSNVPIMDTKIEDAARRFISLVDEFYDHGVKLIISAEASITDIYQGERLRFEFERTQSRLLEMQSHEYLAGSHRA
ncbi:MAG: cell division protein ZapE [Pseudomonadota bacterium]